MVIHKLKFATKMRNTIAPKCRDSTIYHRQTRKFQLERNLLLEHFHRSSSSRHERVTNYKLLSADLDELYFAFMHSRGNKKWSQESKSVAPRLINHVDNRG